MKVISAIALSVFGLYGLVAQNSLSEGSRILGGGISISRSTLNYEDTAAISYQRSDYLSKGLNFSPYYGRIFSETSMIGISLDLRHNSGSDKFEYVSSEDIFDWHDRGIGGGMFLRQYLMMTERFGGFLQGNLNYLLSEYKFTSRFRDFTINNEEVVNDQKRLNHTFSLNVYLGLYYFITDRWSIETRLGAGGFSYSYVTTKYNFDSEEDGYDSTVKTENSSFSVDFINQINFYQAFTINYYF